MSTSTSNLLAALDSAQKSADAAASAAANAPATQLASQGWSPDLIRFLSSSILVFTFGALVLGTILLWRSRANGAQVLRALGVIAIIGISALLLIVGYSNEQLTPIVGLFGAIAGYLLGKETTPGPQRPEA